MILSRDDFGLEKFSRVITLGSTVRLCCYRISKKRYDLFIPYSKNDEIFGISRDRWADLEVIDHVIIGSYYSEEEEVSYIAFRSGITVPHYTIQRQFSKKKREMKFVKVGDSVKIISYDRAKVWQRFMRRGVLINRRAWDLEKTFFEDNKDNNFLVTKVFEERGLISARIRSCFLDENIEFDIPEILLKKRRSL